MKKEMGDHNGFFSEGGEDLRSTVKEWNVDHNLYGHFMGCCFGVYRTYLFKGFNIE